MQRIQVAPIPLSSRELQEITGDVEGAPNDASRRVIAEMEKKAEAAVRKQTAAKFGQGSLNAADFLMPQQTFPGDDISYTTYSKWPLVKGTVGRKEGIIFGPWAPCKTTLFTYVCDVGRSSSHTAMGAAVDALDDDTVLADINRSTFYVSKLHAIHENLLSQPENQNLMDVMRVMAKDAQIDPLVPTTLTSVMAGMNEKHQMQLRAWANSCEILEKTKGIRVCQKKNGIHYEELVMRMKLKSIKALCLGDCPAFSIDIIPSLFELPLVVLTAMEQVYYHCPLNMAFGRTMFEALQATRYPIGQHMHVSVPLISKKTFLAILTRMYAKPPHPANLRTYPAMVGRLALVDIWYKIKEVSNTVMEFSYNVFYELFVRSACMTGIKPWISSPVLGVRFTYSCEKLNGATYLTAQDVETAIRSGSYRQKSNADARLRLMDSVYNVCKSIGILEEHEITTFLTEDMHNPKKTAFFLPCMWEAAEKISIALATVAKRAASGWAPVVKESAHHNTKFSRLNQRQKKAVSMVLTNPVTCVIGPAGTGKSSFTAELFRDVLEEGQARLVTPTHNAKERVSAECGASSCNEKRARTMRSAAFELQGAYHKPISQNELTQEQLVKMYEKERKPPTGGELTKEERTSRMQRFNMNIFLRNATLLEEMAEEDPASMKAHFPLYNEGIAGYLCNPEEDQYTVLVIDEGSMVNLLDLAIVLYGSVANFPICRVVIIGDPYQLQPIESGTPFKDILSTENRSTTAISRALRAISHGIISFNQNYRTETESASIVENSAIVRDNLPEPFTINAAFSVLHCDLAVVPPLEGITRLLQHMGVEDLNDMGVIVNRRKHMEWLNKATFVAVKFWLQHGMVCSNYTALKNFASTLRGYNASANNEYEALRRIQTSYNLGVRYVCISNFVDMGVTNGLQFIARRYLDAIPSFAAALIHKAFVLPAMAETHCASLPASQEPFTSLRDRPPSVFMYPPSSYMGSHELKTFYTDWVQKNGSDTPLPLVRILECQVHAPYLQDSTPRIFYLPLGVASFKSKFHTRLGYVVTDYLAQGGEIVHGAIVYGLPHGILNEPPDFFTSRSSYYTEMTRMKKSLTLVSSMDPNTPQAIKEKYGLREAISRAAVPRKSAILHHLHVHLEPLFATPLCSSLTYRLTSTAYADRLLLQNTRSVPVLMNWIKRYFPDDFPAHEEPDPLLDAPPEESLHVKVERTEPSAQENDLSMSEPTDPDASYPLPKHEAPVVKRERDDPPCPQYDVKRIKTEPMWP